MRLLRGRGAIGLVLTVAVAIAIAARLSIPVNAAAAEPATITGFRSAQFGMPEAEVRKAVAKDFGVKLADIKAETHPTEKTKILLVSVRDLLAESGLSAVAYQFGYRSKLLTQVTITWGHAVDPKSDPQRTVATANILRNHFANQQFQPEGRLLNVPAGENIIVFRGADSAGRLVLLTLVNQPVEKKTPNARGNDQPEPRLSLQLSYSLAADRPDVFTLERGQF